MSTIKLSEISEINKRMKFVLHESRKLYRVSLNAMFASRQINVGIEGFVEVTSLLRNFSSRLDKQVNHLADMVTESVYCIATFLKLKNMMRLIENAFSLIKRRYKTLTIEKEYSSLALEADTHVRNIAAEVERSLMLIGVGENLAVLAKVEASSVPEGINQLNTITGDMEYIIVNINKHISETRYYIAA